MAFNFNPSDLFKGPQPDERGRSSEAEIPSTPLETMSPLGDEAGREPSSGTTLCQQIQKQIDNGSYECGICFEAVNRQSTIWHCDNCWRIYHYECIVDCARGSRRGEGEVPIVEFGQEWKCPSCRDDYDGHPIPTCWCKRRLGTMDEDQDLPFNSCGDCCLGLLSCQHVCGEICHPGPCVECQWCERGIPRPGLPRRRNALRDSLELRRDWVPRVQHFNEQDSERAYDASTAPGYAASNAGPRTLPTRIWVPLVICLAVTIFMAGAIFGLTKVIVEPYNHRPIAENNDAMRAVWILLGLGATINMCMNILSLNRLHDLVDYCEQKISNTSFAATWTSWMRICVESKFCCHLTNLLLFHLLWYVVFAWIVGSFACTLVVPLFARQAEFARVCDGFDTRILLDIRHKVRQNPVFFDYNPKPFQPPYSMAIVDRSTRLFSRTSFELNYYEPAFREAFGIPSTIRVEDDGPRRTIFSNPATNHTYTRTQARLAPDPDSAAMIAAKQRDEYDDDYTPSANEEIEETPGSYRVLYDWTHHFWNTKIGRQTHTDGNFVSIGKHLILPSLGLRIPNLADFEASCKLEPFLEIHRSDADRAFIKDIFGMNRTQTQSLYRQTTAALDRLGRERYRDDKHGTVVLRTVAPGMIQSALEVCAQRRDVVKDGKVVLQGLGESLPVVVGLLASTRYNGWKAGVRGSCKGSWL